jgi:hypothetical protein
LFLALRRNACGQYAFFAINDIHNSKAWL